MSSHKTFVDLSPGELVNHHTLGLCRVTSSFSLSLYYKNSPWVVQMVSVLDQSAHALLGDATDTIEMAASPQRVAA